MLRPRVPLLVATLVSACFSPKGSDPTAGPSTGEGSTSTAETTSAATSTGVGETTGAETTSSSTVVTTESVTGPTTGPLATSTTTEGTTDEATATTMVGPGVCGDGLVDVGEQCDDGNDAFDDGCTPACVEEKCGDGIVQAWEECEDDSRCEQCMRPYFFAFVTSTPVSVTQIGGLDSADKLCTQLANEAGLTGKYVAWLSGGGQGPAARLTHSMRAWHRLDEELIASNWEDLTDASLLAPIQVSENLAPVVGVGGCGECPVWTATDIEGQVLAGDCEGWTAASQMAANIGECTLATALWTYGCPVVECDAMARLYCFEQPVKP